MSTLEQLDDEIRTGGFSFANAKSIRSALEGFGTLTDWPEFAASWDDLGQDTYMADGGRYRKRRHAVFRAGRAGVVRQPAQPHYQSRDYNTLNGGIERWFQPMLPEVGAGETMSAVLHFCQR